MGGHAIPDFKLEHFFARWEFVASHMLGSSDVETLSLAELLALGDRESLEWWAGLRLGYTEVQGHPRLRGAIASLYETVPPESIVVFAGAQEAIFAFMNVVLGRGDHAAVVWPCYQGLYEVGRSAGADVDLVPLRHEEGWRLPVERLAEQMTSRTRAIVMNYPHSPTGAHIDRGTFGSIVQLAETRGAYLCCDEVYRFSEQ